MAEKIFFVLPFLTLATFLFVFHKATSVTTFLLFVLYALPFMDLKVVPEALGGYKTFDVVCFYSLVFLPGPFTRVYTNRFPLYLVLFILFILTALLGSLKSEFVLNSLIGLTRLFPVFIFSRFLLIACREDGSFHLKAIQALKASFSFALIFLLIQIVVGVGFTFYPGLSGNARALGGAAIRYPGVFYDSQTHGQYIAIASFLFLYISQSADTKKLAISYLAFAGAFAGLIMAGSRSAFGGFCVAFLLTIVLAGRKFRLHAILLLVLAATAVFAFAPSSGIFNRADTLNEDYQFRNSIWESAYRIAERHPYLGIGVGNYQKYVSIYSQDQYLENEEIGLYLDQPENGYLKILVEFGFIGFGIFCLFLLLPIFRSFTLLFSGHSDKRIAYILAGLISWLIAFNTVYSFSDHRILIIVVSFLTLLITYPISQNRVNV